MKERKEKTVTDKQETDEKWIEFDGQVTETFNDKVTLISNDTNPVSIDMQPNDVKVEDDGQIYLRYGSRALRVNDKHFNPL